MAHKYGTVIIVIFYCIVLCECQAPSQEVTATEEYIHIISSIPNLFEYLLDTLEKRPEILEDNRNSAFMEFDGQRNKRESDLQGIDEEYSNDETEKDESGDVAEVTEKHEYGQSIKKMKRSRKIFINQEKKKDDTKKIVRVLDMVHNSKIKRSNEFGDSFFGSTNIMWNVSPEEIEEMALRVEKEIEDHVKNRRNRDLK